MRELHDGHLIIIIIIMIISKDNVYGAVVVTYSHCESSPGSLTNVGQRRAASDQALRLHNVHSTQRTMLFFFLNNRSNRKSNVLDCRLFSTDSNLKLASLTSAPVNQILYKEYDFSLLGLQGGVTSTRLVVAMVLRPC